MPTRPLAPLALLVVTLCALATPARADPLAGTFADDALSITLAATPTGYGGTMTLADGKVFPFTATNKAGTLAGRFADAAGEYTFAATLEVPDTLVLRTDKTTHRLARQPAANPQAETIPAPSPRDVEAAIGRAKAYLYALQQNGTWDLPQRRPEPRKEVRTFAEIQNSTQWGGLTALAAYTLLAAGDAPTDPHLAAPLAFLKDADVDGTYALACRLLVWNAMPPSARESVRDLAKRDRDLLLKNRRAEGAAKGLFRYLADDVGADHSASQFGVLGLWAADQMGAEVPAAVWRDAETAWLADQRNDGAQGGWAYAGPLLGQTPVTPSMTAAGVATLFITADALRPKTGVDCRGNPPNKAIDAGLAWIDAHAEDYFLASKEFSFYALYGLERIGLASGRKYLGRVDWYRRGADALLQTQDADGSWGGNVADTCFGILFLVRGRAPLVMSKLQYTLDTRGDTPRPANWNQRPRDAANVTRWLGRQLERELAWQVVDLSGKPEDLHDAPILYIAGNQQLQFSDADEDKLRQFVHQGGLILGHADCAGPNFATSFKKLGQKLFPPYEFRELPAAHPIYHGVYPRTAWKLPPQVQGLSNGVRELMILLPTGDPARFWQTGAVGGREPAFQLLADLFLYCSENGAAGGRDFRHRGESTWITADPDVAATRTLKLARLQHDFNWNPEPGGWQRLANILHNQDHLDLAADAVKLGDGKLAAGGYALAHLTAAGRVKLTDPQRAELKAYVNAGGTLLIDAAGGDAEAAAALEAEIAALLPTGGGKPQTLPPDHPLYAHLDQPAESIAYRPYAIKRSVGKLTGPRLRAAPAANRPAAILYSPEDLTVALVGHGVDGIYGYTPASATAIVRSIVLTAAGGE